MSNLIEILKEHAEKYPLMEPCDAVKLIYQNEFGGGHLITDEKKCLQRITEEYNSIEHDFSLPVTENIGNGLVRVNLHALDTSVCTLERLANSFIVSSRLHKGSKMNLLEKLYDTQIHFESIGFRFSSEEFHKYIEEYTAMGFPLVSHSKRYKDAYSPAYRVLIGNNISL